MSLIHLELSSFRGTSIGAVHWYGKIWCRDRGINEELDYEIEQKHRDWMFDVYRKQGFTETWSEEEVEWNFPLGQRSGRFFEKEHIDIAAGEWFDKNADSAKDVLVRWKGIHHFNSKHDLVLRAPDYFFDGIKGAPDNEIESLLRIWEQRIEWKQ